MDFYSKNVSAAFINKVVVLQKSICQPSIYQLSNQFLGSKKGVAIIFLLYTQRKPFLHVKSSAQM